MDELEYQLLRRHYVNTPSEWGNLDLVMSLIDAAASLLTWLLGD